MALRPASSEHELRSFCSRRVQGASLDELPGKAVASGPLNRCGRLMWMAVSARGQYNHGDQVAPSGVQKRSSVPRNIRIETSGAGINNQE